MRSRADAVVIGGGILGTAAALSLIEAGVDEVIVIERDGVAEGTSRAGAGFIGMWGAGYVAAWSGEELDVEERSLDFYADLAAGSPDFGYRRNGTLWIATSEAEWKRHVLPMAEHTRVADRRELEGEEIEELTGIVSADAVYRGVLHPGGGYLSAPRATLAIAERLRERGGTMRTRCPAERILVAGSRVAGVQTTSGRIDAEVVVVACGAWSNQLLGELGLWAPMTPLVASRIITEPLGLSSTMPTITVPEYAFMWVREEQGALLWGVDYEQSPHDALVDAAVPDRFDQLPLDGLFQTRAVGERALDLIPTLGRFKSMSVTHGAPTFTPDQRGLVGSFGDIDGLYLLAGCNEGGISHAPGWGQMLAGMIAGGAGPGAAAAPFSPNRFGETYKTGRDVLEALGGGWGERSGEHPVRTG